MKMTTCNCMTEPDENGVERVLVHSSDCALHPEYEPPPHETKLLPIVRAAADAQKAKTVLHNAIRLAHEDRHSLREIAQAAGMSHEQVRRIVSG